MTKVKRGKKWTEFSFEYTIQHFAALESLSPSSRKGEDRDEWASGLLGEAIACRINGNNLKLHQEYEGEISIELADLEPSSAVVGQDLKIRLQKHDQSHGHLPTATFKVKIRIRGLDGSVRRGLLAILKESGKANWAFLIQNNLKRRRRDFKRFRDGKLTEKEARKEDLNQLELILNKAEGMFGQSLDDEEKFWSALDEAMPVFAELAEVGDRRGRNYRFRLGDYLERFKDAAKKKTKTRRTPKFDVDVVEEFADDFVSIFRHYMNLIIRFLKYDKQQYWLQEIPKAARGYFFLENAIFMDEKGPLIPNAKHQMELERLPEDYRLSVEEWKKVTNTTKDVELLSTRAGSFTLGGVFSQAIMAVEEDHLETAVILGMVGFEAALNGLLEYFDEIEDRPIRYSKKVNRAKKILARRLPLCELGGEKVLIWRAIEGAPKASISRPRKYYDYEDGLIPLRNDIIHEKYEVQNDQQKRVVGYIAAARSFAFVVDNFLQADPLKGRVELTRRKKW